MKTFISLLRGINVSGYKKIKMAELKILYESLGFENVETYVQSGNVVFYSIKQNSSGLADIIEKQIKKSFGYDVSVFIRNTKDLQQIISNNPFLAGRNEDPVKLHVTFLYESPSKLVLKNLENTKAKDADEFVVKGKEIYLFCPNGYGRTKLSNSFFEKKLNLPATTRNWKTVYALYGIAIAR